MTDLADFKRVNWAEAFSQYCQGVSLPDIAAMLQISEHRLEVKASSERWPTLKARVEAASQSLVPVSPDEIARRASLIQENREKNYRAWCDLRDDALDLITELRSSKGKGMVKKLFHFKGDVVEHTTDMSIAERATFGNYLQVISQGTYAALGDRVCSTGAKDDATSNPTGTPGITIILPGVIAKPRGTADEKKVAGSDATVSKSAAGETVIDLREV